MFLEILARRKTKSLTLQHKKIKKNKKTKQKNKTLDLFIIRVRKLCISFIHCLYTVSERVILACHTPLSAINVINKYDSSFGKIFHTLCQL